MKKEGNPGGHRAQKLLSAMFPAIPVLLLIVSITITIGAFQTLRNEMAEKQLSITQQAKSNMDYRMVQHEEIANGIMLSIYGYLNERSDSAAQYAEFVSISNLLASYMDRGMISAIRLYVPDEKSYSTQRDVLYPLSDLMEGEYGDHASIGIHWLDTHKARIAFGRNASAIALMYNVSKLHNHDQLAGSLLLYLPVDKLNGIFDANGSGGDELLLVDRNGVTLAHQRSELIGQTLLSEQEIRLLRSRRFGYQTSQQGILSFSRLEKTEWYLVARSGGLKTMALDASHLFLLGALWTVTALSLGYVFLALMYNRLIGETISTMQDMAQSLIPDGSAEPAVSDGGGGARRTLSNARLGRKLEQTMQTMAKGMEMHYQEKIDLTNYQMQSLQAQIKPHFLYNTLDVIKWMIVEGNYQDGIWMVNALSKYLRMSINKKSGVVTLREEIQLGSIYLDIIQKRFKGRFRIAYDLEDAALECRLPRLLLQPVLENAVIHGLLYCEKEDAVLQVRAWLDGDDLCVEIEDNGNGMAAEKLEMLNSDEAAADGGYGLKNIRKRLRLFGGAMASLSIHSREGVGTCVAIRLPVTPVQSEKESL